jgi:putative ABC transport system permease protein
MMASLTNNRWMFWRIIRRLLLAHRGRLFVVLLGLGAGAAVTAALLNLQVDAKRRLTSEFRAFGANVIIAPRHTDSSVAATLDESILQRIPWQVGSNQVLGVGLLYAVIDVSVSSHANPLKQPSKPTPVVLAGYSSDIYRKLLPSHALDLSQPTGWTNTPLCYAGSNVARRLNLHARDFLFIGSYLGSQYADTATQAQCFLQGIDSYGGPEDNQIFVNLEPIQKLQNLQGRLSVVELRIPGSPQEISRYVAALQKSLPDADVRPIRQFTEGEAKIYNRISGLLNFTVAIVLILTALCVMAAMTNVAMERRNDVGLMKAIGGAKRRVLRLFLTEATILGLAGGILGAAIGIGLSIWLGKAVFGLAARPRLIVYPVSVLLTMLVAILGAFPLRHLANVRPASVFRGEA